jgi:replicative DNA helicase
MSKAQGGLLISPAQAFDRWLEFEGNPDRIGLRFNIPVIDNEMTHGILPGAVILLGARTNAGKTIFSLNVMHRMRMLKPDLNILFMSLEQTRNEWFERAHRINNFYNPGATTLDTINYWKDNLYLVDENRISEAVLEMCIEQYTYESGRVPDLVVLDYLGYYGRSFPGEEYARMTSAIMGLKGIAKRQQLAFLVPHQGNRSNEMGSELRMDQGRGAGTVEETADIYLTLWNPDQREGVQTKQDMNKELILKMGKSRDGGTNTLAVFQHAPLTLAIVPKDDALYERALRERQYWIAGYNWKDAVNAYITGDESVKWVA